MRKDELWNLRNGTYIETTRPTGYDVLINGTDRYLNFYSISGASGYGFRDNAGIIEFKNSGGTWAAFGTGGGTWGTITGTLSAQTDLQAALDLKAPLLNPHFASNGGFWITPTTSATSILLFDNITGANAIDLQVPITGSWTINMPNKSGTLAVLSDIPTSFVSSLSSPTTNITFSASTGAVNADVNQAYGYTWTGQHTFGVPIGVNGVTNPAINAGVGLSLKGDIEFRSSSNINQQTGRVGITNNNYYFGYGNFSTLLSTSGAVFNIALGESSLGLITGGTSNIAVGYYALGSAVTTDVNFNIGIGDSSLFSLTFGSGNMGIGTFTLSSLTSGNDNVGIGNSALGSILTGDGNVGIGSGALVNITNASSNVGIGLGSGLGITTGSNNTAIGYQSMYGTTTTSSGNVAIGYQAMFNGGANGNNIALGTAALSSITLSASNIAIGAGAASSLQDNDYNIAIGGNALNANVHGGSNVAIGLNAGFSLTTSNNFILGINAGTNLTSGASNFMLGSGIEFPSNTVSNQLVIVNAIFGTGMNGSGTTIATGTLGAFVTSPTASWDIGASTTDKSSLRIRSGTAPTSPNDGDIWYDGTNLKMRVGGTTKTFTLI